MLLVNYLGFSPSVPDIVRSLPGAGRILSVSGRVSQHFSQDVVYQVMHDFDLDGNVILSLSDDPMIYLDTVPQKAGRFLKIDIGALSEDPTSAQIFFAFEGDHYFNQRDSVRFYLESGLNIIPLPYSGYYRLRLDLAEAPYISLIVNDVTTANYVLLPASFWISLSFIVLAFAIFLYFWFLRRDLLKWLYGKLEKRFQESAFYRGGYKSEKNRYLIAVVFVGLLIVLTYWFVPVRFGTVDDVTLMYIVSGNFTGSPSPYLFWSNIIYGYILSGLYELLPMIPWYGIMQIVFIYFSQVLIAKSFLKIATKKGTSIVVPLGLYSILYVFILFYWTAVLQFTTTPAMMGAAACVVAASLFCGESKRARIVDIASIVTLIFFAYMIRRDSGMGVLPFLSVMLTFKVAMSLISKEGIKHRLRKVCVYVFIGICVVGLLFTAREINSRMASIDGRIEFSRWNSQVSRFMDYLHVSYHDNPELYESIGWDRELYSLVRQWNHLDERVTVENLRVLNLYSLAHSEQLSSFQRLIESINLVETFIRDNNIAESAIRVVVIGFALHIAVIIWQKSKTRTTLKQNNEKHQRYEQLFHLLLALTVFGGYIASLVWLGWGKRINLRAFFVPLMPTACILFWHILYKYGSDLSKNAKKYLPLTLCVCFALGFYFANVPFHTAFTEAVSVTAIRDAERRLLSERHAIDNQDDVFVLCPSISGATVPIFTNYRNGRPYNLIAPTGGRSRNEAGPVAMATLRANGLSGLSGDTLTECGVYWITRSVRDRRANEVILYMQSRFNAIPIITDYFNDVFVISFVEVNQLLANGDAHSVLYHVDTISICMDEKIFIYDLLITPSANTNYLVAFDIVTEDSPESFWIEWYGLTPESGGSRQLFVHSFDVNVGHNTYFESIFIDNMLYGGATNFRIMTNPTSNMLITNFSIRAVCTE